MDEAHLWYDLVHQESSGTRQLGCDDSGPTPPMVQEPQLPKVSNTAFLGVWPFLQPTSNNIGNMGGGVPVSGPGNGDQHGLQASRRGSGEKEKLGGAHHI